MQVQVHYQGFDHSPWVDQLITSKVAKLERYLSPSATLQVHLKLENNLYHSTIAVHNLSHDYAFNADGENMYESFTGAVDKASRSLSEHKRRVKNRIGRNRQSLRDFAA